MRRINPEQMTLTNQSRQGVAARVVLDEDTISRMDVHHELFDPSRSDLPQHLVEAAGTITPVEGGHSDAVDQLVERGVDALDGAFSAAVASGLVQADRRDGDLDGRDAWLQLIWTTRNLPQYHQGSFEDIFDGPIALLAQLDHAPQIEVELPSRFVETFTSTERTRLFGYLRRLTPGVDVYLTGSRITLKRVLAHHADDLPADVSERAQGSLRRGSHVDRSPERVAEDALDQLGLGDRQAGYWRLLTRACEHQDGSVRQADLQDDVLADVDPSTIRKRAARLEELSLIDRPTRNGETFIEPTAAGQQALAQAQSDAPSLVSGWSTGDAPSRHGGSPDAANAAVNDPPNPAAEPCTPNACEGGGDGPATGDRPTAEAQAATAGGSPSSPAAVQYLSMHEHHGAAAAAPNRGGVALERRAPAGTGDDREVSWSLDDTRDEVVVEVTASPAMAVTAVRLCEALLNEKAERDVLKPAKLNGGPDRFDLDGLAVSEPYLLRAGRTLGWLKDSDAEGGRYLARLRQAKNELKQALSNAAENAENGVYDHDALSKILKKAHGLQGVIIAVYDLLGYDVVRKLQVPEPGNVDAEALGHFVHHQTAVSSRYGIYTAYRYLYEDDDEKRDDTLDSTPTVGPDDYRGTISAPWVIESSTPETYRDALENPGQYPFELQEDKPAFFEFALDLEVVDGHRRDAVSELVSRLGPSKNLHSSEEMTTLLQAMTASTATAAAVIGAMGSADEPREMDHGDLEWGLKQLPEMADHRVEEIVPEIGGPTVSKALHALLGREDTLSKTGVAKAADVSTQSLRNNEDAFAHLETLGLLDISDSPEGSASSWSFSFPAAGEANRGPGEDAPDGLAEIVLGAPAWGGEGWRIDEAIGEFLLQLHDDADLTLPIAPGSEQWLTAFSGQYDEGSLCEVLDELAHHRGAVRLLATLLTDRLPDEWTSSTARHGREPAAVTQQQSLTAAAAD